MANLSISRRQLAIGAGALFLASAPRAWADDTPVVQVADGKVRGRLVDGVAVFKGMRYGASTAGANRFMPPRPVEPWTGVMDAFDYGDQSPQSTGPLAYKGPMSEDCLRINVWTPATDGGKRPVMLWFHGGGFEAGSGSSAMYDGVRLAKRGDVVVATINHRLNVFGHCYLGEAMGSDFAESGNVGYLDLVAAMKWVKANASAFGGDPNKVMIFGQSGGGRKVSLCFAGPAAQGLFHRGVVESGSHLRIQTTDQAAKITDALLRRLSIARGDLSKLRSIPMAQLIDAQRAVIDEAGYRFSPVLDHKAFTAHPFLPNAPAISSNIPMLVGTTRTELSNQLGAVPGIFDLDETGLTEKLKDYLDEKDIPEAIRLFRTSRPQANPTELFFTIATARGYVRDQTIMAEQRVKAHGSAPTYVYHVMWRSPAEGGRRISEHTLEIPFVFDNVARTPNLTGPETEETRTLVNSVSESWLAFARTGNPNNKYVPKWQPYDLAHRTTMLLDTPCAAVSDPQKNERLFMSRYPTQQMEASLIQVRKKS